MQIKVVNRIYDDDGIECKEGDNVLIRTHDMDNITLARIQTIMTNSAIFFFDDKVIGIRPITLRTEHIAELRKYTGKNI